MKFKDYKAKEILPQNYVLGIVLHVKENNHISPRLFAKRGTSIQAYTKYDEYNVVSNRLGYPLLAVYLTNIEVDKVEAEPDNDFGNEVLFGQVEPNV